MSTHVFTSIATNYIPKARVLAKSLKALHPNISFHVVLCDSKPAWFQLDGEPFDSLLTIDDFELTKQWVFKHTIVELSTAVKGFALCKLLNIPGCEQVLYFDPDMVILSPLNGLLSEFESADILLTPHITEPETTLEGILDNEFSVLQHGIYNLGFVGVKNSPRGRAFAEWWRDRLDHFCYDDIPRGLFTDQRWADLVPAYFPTCQVLRDPVYNVCTWNLNHRNVTGSVQEGFFANRLPIVFYHFSGFDSGAQELMLNKYGKGMPALFELRDWYIKECEHNGQTTLSRSSWAFGFYQNGERIASSHRKLYRQREDLQQAFLDPFRTADPNKSYLHWLVASGEAGTLQEQLQDLPDTPNMIPDYRIVVLALEEDYRYLHQTLASLAEKSFRKADVVLILSFHNPESFPLPLAQSQIVVECATYDELFAAAIARFGEKDIALVRAGVLVPIHWDLRLAWASCRQLGTATVSPLNAADLGTNDAHIGLDQLDALCSLYRGSNDHQAAQFSLDCVYLRTEALQTLGRLNQSQTPLYLLDSFARTRFSHQLASHVCIKTQSSGAGAQWEKRDSTVFATSDHIRHAIESHLNSQLAPPPSVLSRMTLAKLHIGHSWGGGLDHWISNYCLHDSEHDNYVLQSFGPFMAFGSELRLFRKPGETEPLETWTLDPPIKATSGSDDQYATILNNIRLKYGIGQIFISSLIGHSVEAMRQPVPTVLVCHEYYPFCPALNITFGEICTTCDQQRLAACIENNPLNQSFRNVTAAEWLNLRTQFIHTATERRIPLIAPSASLQRNYKPLVPQLNDRFHVIEHGADPVPGSPLSLNFDSSARLRIILLGRLVPQKGSTLFDRMLPELLQFADILLVGCGENGRHYANTQGITVIPNYKLPELSGLLSELQPQLALLLSTVPETYSYTLRELQDLGVPAIATRIGSFEDRIQDNVTGFLCDLEISGIVNKIKTLADNRTLLRRVHNNLRALRTRSVADMLRDYEELFPAVLSSKKYFATKPLPPSRSRRELQVYWRTLNSEWHEHNSHKLFSTGNGREIAKLRIPPQKDPLDQLRLDLFSEPSLFLLYRITLRDLKRNLIWEWKAPTELDAATLKDILVMPVPSDEGTLLYLSSDDPYMMLPLRAPDLTDAQYGAQLEVQFNVPSAQDQMRSLYSSIAAHHAEVERLSRIVAEKDTEIDNLVHSVSWRITKPARDLMALKRKL